MLYGTQNALLTIEAKFCSIFNIPSLFVHMVSLSIGKDLVELSLSNEISVWTFPVYLQSCFFLSVSLEKYKLICDCHHNIQTTLIKMHFTSLSFSTQQTWTRSYVD
jgi:hypothetical protein